MTVQSFADHRMLSHKGRLPTGKSVQRRVWLRMSLLVVGAALLGRATITSQVAPFAFAYFIVLTEILGTKRSWPAWAAIVGATLSGGVGSAAILLVEFLFYRLVRKILFRGKAPDLHWIPFIAAGVDVVVRLAAVGTVWTRYDVLLALADGGLVAVLYLIFFQTLPIFAGKETNHTLHSEQWISLAILLGSVSAGLTGWTVHGVSVLNMAVDWLVLLMAAAGGAGMATTTAAVLGILTMMDKVQSLSGVAVLVFAGLLAGILKDGRRGWQSLAFILGMGLLTFGTTRDWQTVGPSLLAATAASILALFTSNRVIETIASYIPGTLEHRVTEQSRVRRVRTLLSERIEELGQVFDELSYTFADTAESPLFSAQQLLDETVSGVARHVCSGCPRRSKCWDKESYGTYQAMVRTLEKIEAQPGGHVFPSRDLKERCIRIDPMMEGLRRHLELMQRDALWVGKVREQRTLVSAQLSGVAGVMRGLSSQLNQHNETSLAAEEQVLFALEQMGLYVDHVHIVSLEPGKVEVEVSQPSKGAYEHSVRMIAPLLSGVLGEHITVGQVEETDGGPCMSVFRSARLFQVETAVANVPREGRSVSGDTYTAVDLGNGKFALGVSDGMGNGEKARRESKAAIELLKKLMKAGFDEQLAVRTVNSALLLRSQDEMFTTLDMALIDLYSAHTEFLKIGSAPSYIKRDHKVIPVTGANVPMGILQDIDVQTVDEQLNVGDVLILMSDGIYDAPQQGVDREVWLRHQIERLETSDAQEIADTLLESAMRMCRGAARDDMTVMVAKISEYQPEWSSISWPGLAGLRRNKERRRQGA